jgi:ABC-type dipeptide/oligopeptide/nickel transport system ATPase subunit
MNKLLEIKNISYWINNTSFSKNRKKILEENTFDIFEGEILAIVGESGAGKSTLAKIIAGIISASSGVIITKIDLKENQNSKPIQLLFQNSEDLINPQRKVKDIIADRSEDDDNFKGVLSEVGVSSDLLYQLGYKVSGGERQRIGLARLLVTKPKLLILDEPFSAQDVVSKTVFKGLLIQLKTHNNLTLIVITHEINLLKDFADRVVVMYGGHIIEIADCHKFFTNPGHPYSRFLINSSNYKLERKDILQTNVDKLFICNYYSRCERRRDECTRRLDFINTEDSIVYCNFPYNQDS